MSSRKADPDQEDEIAQRASLQRHRAKILHDCALPAYDGTQRRRISAFKSDPLTQCAPGRELHFTCIISEVGPGVHNIVRRQMRMCWKVPVAVRCSQAQ
eukprot:6205713-Pleurochrysis_carterae.AAC.2